MDVSAELDMDEARKRQLVDATINNEIEVVVNMIEADLALIDHRVNRRSTLLVSRQSGLRKFVRLSGVGLNAVHVVLRGASETRVVQFGVLPPNTTSSMGPPVSVTTSSLGSSHPWSCGAI